MDRFSYVVGSLRLFLKKSSAWVRYSYDWLYAEIVSVL